MSKILSRIDSVINHIDSTQTFVTMSSNETKENEQTAIKAVVCGGINIDRFIEVGRMPVTGETIMGDNSFHGVGGKAANTAVCCSKMGGKTDLIAAFGDDIHTPMLQSAMKEYDVSTQHCFVLNNSNIPCGQAYIFLMPNGDNSIIVVPAANNNWKINEMNEKDNPKQIECIRNADCILLQREVSELYNLEICRLLKGDSNDGVEVILDAGGEDSEIDLELFKYVTIFSPNETELARLIKHYKNKKDESKNDSDNDNDNDNENEKNIISNCKLIQEIVSKSEKAGFNKKLKILAKLGSKGCIMVDYDGNVYQQSAMKVDKEKVVDTTGAGDTFTGAFGIEYIRQKKNKDIDSKSAICNAMKYACCAAGLSVQTKGTLPSIPDHSTVIKNLSNM